ncbi:MAG: DNA-3-methyladenine glycosylase, partial [Cyanobacteria bacterium]|nr:DNA-3-methyladenine glycosylase [Cyanobacteriota bacterium]
MASSHTQHLPQSFFARPAELVAPSPSAVCHGYWRRFPSTKALFGEPGRFYV